MDYTQWTAALRQTLGELARAVGAYQAQLVGAVVLLLVGWLLARLLRALAVRLIAALDRLLPGRALRGRLQRAGMEHQISNLIGALVFWGVVVLFVAAAGALLELPVLSAWLTGLAFYVPRLLGAALVLVIGLIGANLARDAIAAAATAGGIAYGATLGQIARVALLVAAGLIALSELGIDITLLTAILSVALAATLGGLALAFGLGARTAVSNIIGAHYLRQTFRVGQTVRLGSVEGEITAITATTVILRASGGQVVVPAKRFSEASSTLVTLGG